MPTSVAVRSTSVAVTLPSLLGDVKTGVGDTAPSTAGRRLGDTYPTHAGSTPSLGPEGARLGRQYAPHAAWTRPQHRGGTPRVLGTLAGTPGLDIGAVPLCRRLLAFGDDRDLVESLCHPRIAPGPPTALSPSAVDREQAHLIVSAPARLIQGRIL